jgi:hypothetical protein
MQVYFQFEHLELASSNWMALFDLFCDMVKGQFFAELRWLSNPAVVSF